MASWAQARAIAMALLSLYGPEERISSVTNRVLFEELFGWMMLCLGLLAIGIADHGLAVIKHARDRGALRGVRYQAVIAAVLASAAFCLWFGLGIGEHFRALIGMGINAFTAFMSVGLVRYIPEHVFNSLVWALPSTAGFALIIGFSLQAKRKAAPHASKVAKPQMAKPRSTSA